MKMALWQRFPHGQAVAAAESPVLHQLLFMYHRPFLYEVQSPGRQFTLDNIQRGKIDRRLEFANRGTYGT
jgi:hypothetical protein